jgi:hypothetical protein
MVEEFDEKTLSRPGIGQNQFWMNVSLSCLHASRNQNTERRQMSYPGYHAIMITGPEADIERLRAQMESDDGDRYLCVEDPERKCTHSLWVVEEQRDGASLILNLGYKWGPHYRVFELLIEKFPALTIDGTIDCIDWDFFRIKVFCHGGKAAFSDTTSPADFDGYLTELFDSEIARVVAGKWREEPWHGCAPKTVVEWYHSGAQAAEAN